MGSGGGDERSLLAKKLSKITETPTSQRYASACRRHPDYPLQTRGRACRGHPGFHSSPEYRILRIKVSNDSCV
jgi:hypothetical protein